MTTMRIDFKSGEGDDGRVLAMVIDRTFPAGLNGLMSTNTWNNFCDQVDTANEPLNKAFKMTMKRPLLFFGVPIVAFAIMLVLAIFVNPLLAVGLFGGLFVLLAGVAFFTFSSKFKVVLEARKELESVCENTSKQYSDISFHVRNERTWNGHNRRSTLITYIEVITSNNTGPSDQAFDSTYSAFPIGVGAASAANGKSAAERLTELETVKDIISTEEYERKKQAILSDI